MRPRARGLAKIVTLIAGLAAVYAGATGIAFARMPAASTRPPSGWVRAPALLPPRLASVPALGPPQLAKMPTSGKAPAATMPTPKAPASGKDSAKTPGSTGAKVPALRRHDHGR